MKCDSTNKSMKVAILALGAISLLAACDMNKASISFSLTDAPIDPSTAKAVNLTVSSIAVNENGAAAPAESSWIARAIDPPLVVNLLDLQNGITADLGDLPVEGGTQV